MLLLTELLAGEICVSIVIFVIDLRVNSIYQVQHAILNLKYAICFLYLDISLGKQNAITTTFFGVDQTFIVCFFFYFKHQVVLVRCRVYENQLYIF